jgi:hypothetical protein
MLHLPQPLRRLAAALLTSGVGASAAHATDFTQFAVTRIRVASVSPIPCPGAAARMAECVRVGVVVLFRQASGTEAGISTHYVTGGTLVADMRRDFGPYAPVT